MGTEGPHAGSRWALQPQRTTVFRVQRETASTEKVMGETRTSGAFCVGAWGAFQEPPWPLGEAGTARLRCCSEREGSSQVGGPETRGTQAPCGPGQEAS